MDLMEINEKLQKPYDPEETEPRIYALWEDSGFFNPDNLPGQRENPFFMWGDGTQKRAFVYVEDLARALITIAASPTVDEQHHIVSLYGSETITMNELAETIMNIEHFKVPISHDTTKGNEQPSGNNESTMDTPIPALQLDAKPTPLVEGLTKTIAWYKAHHS